MKFKKMPLKELIPADYNPRQDLQPSDEEYKKLKRSIETFGYVLPIIWNKTTKRVISGHQRLKVMQDLDIKEDKVVEVEIDAEKEQLLNIALNKIDGSWDMPKLKDLIQELDTGAYDVTLTGFDEAEIERIMTEHHMPDESEDYTTLVFRVTEEQARTIRAAMGTIDLKSAETFGNKNKNGNAIYEVVRQWAEQRT